MKIVDCLILGAGAAGLFCAARTAARGRSTIVLDHARKPAEKIRISGGGRCNFTNLYTNPQNFISNNPHFAKSALARYTPYDFCDLMSTHGLSWTEKILGQLFCDQKSGAIINMLLQELSDAGGALTLNTDIIDVQSNAGKFIVSTSEGQIETTSLVIATGGLSIPKMGATGLAYEIARQFGHTIIDTRPALVPFTFSGQDKDDFAAISGVSLDVRCQAAKGPDFRENLLFTHRGLSGPAMLQISSYWHLSETVRIDLFPDHATRDWLLEKREDTPTQTLQQALSEHLPNRMVPLICRSFENLVQRKLAELSNSHLDDIVETLKAWTLKPAGTEGWRTAEVTAGGICTGGLSSKTMESRHQSGLYFIGECVDVTGWLGGYNFQWAWASAAAAGAHA
ncbi:MAG: aminoacetone oxidase family FAD-binding enzyme [Hyphomonadaceae bacterium]|nr:aminoacetone oxidase family FAD-binding enzyme [Hyphomonadaceae bacterium]OUX95531.1 MAG: aminoacetone oxidase family FAD-binding enzyme [Hyphomonas sp. TMED17]CAI8300583.1 MAG: Ferredoxin--NADP reductase [Hyphomonas sp. TMED17]